MTQEELAQALEREEARHRRERRKRDLAEVIRRALVHRPPRGVHAGPHGPAAVAWPPG